MKNIKRIFAAIILLAMLASVVGCHKKNEVAVTVGDIEFTSAYYMCALINADSEAKTKIQEELTEEEQTAEVDYYSKKIDKKNYVDWVEDRAIDSLKKIAAYKTLCNEAKLKLEDDVIANAESYASYYWTSYGYSAYFEPNGVGQATYTEYMKDAYYSNLYFEHLYGKEGEKAIEAEKVKSAIFDNFLIANQIDVTFSEETDEQKAAIKAKLENYVTALKNGSMTFEQVYKDYNGTTEEQETETTESTEPAPADKYASVLGAKETAYESEYYDTAKEMAKGEIELVEKESGAGYLLLVKQDIQADSYYIENLDLSARHLLADDEYEEYIEKYAKDLKVNINKYAVNQFKVKKIIEPAVNA